MTSPPITSIYYNREEHPRSPHATSRARCLKNGPRPKSPWNWWWVKFIYKSLLSYRRKIFLHQPTPRPAPWFLIQCNVRSKIERIHVPKYCPWSKLGQFHPLPHAVIPCTTQVSSFGDTFLRKRTPLLTDDARGKNPLAPVDPGKDGIAA